MPERRLLLQYENEEFLQRFAAYLRRKAALPLEICCAADAEALRELTGEGADLLIVSETLYRSQTWPPNTLYFTEKTGALPEQAVPLYKAVSTQIGKIRRALDQSPSALPTAPAACTVLGFYSPVRGAGQTAGAVLAGLFLAESAPTIFLNMERVSALGEFLPLQGGSLSDLLYFARVQGDPFGRIEEYTDYLGPLALIGAPVDPADPENASEEDWRYLFQELRTHARYRFAVVDLGDGFGKERLLMSLCDQIFMPVKADAVSRAKERVWLKRLEEAGEKRLAEKIRCYALPAFSGEAYADYRELRLTEWGRILRETLTEAGL